MRRLLPSALLVVLIGCGSDETPHKSPDDQGRDAGSDASDESDGGVRAECARDEECDEDERCEDGECVAIPPTMATATIDLALDFRARHFTRWGTLEMRATVSRDDEVLFEGTAPVSDIDEEHLDATISFDDVPLEEELVVHAALYAAGSELGALLEARAVHTFQDGAAMAILGNADLVPQYEADGTTERDPFANLISYLFAGFPSPGTGCLQTSDCEAGLVCSELGRCVDAAQCRPMLTTSERPSANIECEPARLDTTTCEAMGEGTGPLHCREDCTLSLDWCGNSCAQNWVACEDDADCCSGACDHFCVPTLAWQRATTLSGGGWRRIAATQTFAHYVSPRVIMVGEAGAARVESFFPRLDFAEQTTLVTGSPTQLRAAYAAGGSHDYVAGDGGLSKYTGTFTALTLPASHGVFRAVTAVLAYDDLGHVYGYDASVGDGVTIREGVAINAATALPTTSPAYRDWAVGDEGTVALVSSSWPVGGQLAVPEVSVLRASGANLYGVAHLDDFAWAVGESGSVVRCDTFECEDVTIPGLPAVTLRDVAAVGKVLYMVGDAGTIVSYAPDTGYLVNSSNAEYGKLVSVAAFTDNTHRQPILVLNESGVIWQRAAPF